MLFRFAMVVLLTILSGCSALRRPMPEIDRTQDSRIQSDVEARLASVTALDAGSIRVEVDGAIVILHGSVRGIAAWNCAIRTAQLVAGVRSVTDFLVIEAGPREIACGT